MLLISGMTDDRQGIVHVVGPEQGFTLPGTTVVCGDFISLYHGAWFIGFVLVLKWNMF